MSDYFKVKSVLQGDGSSCKINIVKFHGEKEGKYGKFWEYDILCDGVPMKWYASENQQKKIKEVGKVNFIIKRWDKDGRTGFNFFPPGDVNVQKQNVKSQPSYEQRQDEFQNKTSRGASWNKAFDWCLIHHPDLSLSDFLNKVDKVGETIAPRQKAFVDGKNVKAKIEIEDVTSEIKNKYDPEEDVMEF